MESINLQNKTKPKIGRGEIYWFENKNIGLQRTLFHRFYIPLTPFDSGLEYESQPLETEIVFEWLNLKLIDPTDLDGLELTSKPDDDLEVSIYVGGAHNLGDVKTMKFHKIDGERYELDCNLFIYFEREGVAQNEEFHFNTEVTLDKKIKE